MENIKVKNLSIPKTAVIGKNVQIECETFQIGEHARIGDNVKINCKSFIADDWLYICNDVEVGRGGCYGPKSNVYIGKHVGIFERTIINPSDEVYIGDNVGIGGEVMIWTHGAWLDVTEGFPSDFGPVKIGNNVWLPARSIVLPNVEIGDNTVIGIGSIINRNIPSGCFAAGSPCKVIHKDCYPNKLNNEDLNKLMDKINLDYKEIIKDKNIEPSLDIRYDKNTNILTLNEIYFGAAMISHHYNIKEKTYEGSPSDVSEDLRDYLRRRGIKIFTNNSFKSIKPKYL